jgi:hypothetical protein
MNSHEVTAYQMAVPRIANRSCISRCERQNNSEDASCSKLLTFDLHSIPLSTVVLEIIRPYLHSKLTGHKNLTFR